MSTRNEIELHGHRVCFRLEGEGPVVVLIHGITGRSEQWEPAMDHLAAEHTVLAPDLLGHGESAKPRGDYSLGAYASAVRDIMVALGHDSATIVGHSLGGGIAMQFAYQFPERTERLVLVSSGGLGRDVHLLLRAASLPGSDIVLPALTSQRLVELGRGLGGLLGRIGLHPSADIAVLARGFAELDNAGSRQAFLATLRAVVEPGGQKVSANSRLALAASLPSLIVWGENDSIIPVKHGAAAHEAMPGSRFVVFEGAGHMPQEDQPHHFAAVVGEFCDATEPARLTRNHWQPLLEGKS